MTVGDTAYYYYKNTFYREVLRQGEHRVAVLAEGAAVQLPALDHGERHGVVDQEHPDHQRQQAEGGEVEAEGAEVEPLQVAMGDAEGATAEAVRGHSLELVARRLDGGDGRDVWPWSDLEVRDRFDVSKLAQWEIVMSHMDRLGMQLMLITQEEENEQILGKMTPLRKLYYRELIARFSIPSQSCVLAHVTSQLEAIEAGAPVVTG